MTRISLVMVLLSTALVTGCTSEESSTASSSAAVGAQTDWDVKPTSASGDVRVFCALPSLGLGGDEGDAPEHDGPSGARRVVSMPFGAPQPEGEHAEESGGPNLADIAARIGLPCFSGTPGPSMNLWLCKPNVEGEGSIPTTASCTAAPGLSSLIGLFGGARGADGDDDGDRQMPNVEEIIKATAAGGASVQCRVDLLALASARREGGVGGMPAGMSGPGGDADDHDHHGPQGGEHDIGRHLVLIPLDCGASQPGAPSQPSPIGTR